MTPALATLSIFVALALVAFVSYQAGEFIRSYGRDARISNVYELALKEPPKGLEAVVSILREHDEHLLANSVNAICLTFWDQLADELDRSSRLHRRAQKAEGLLARREAKLERERDRARKLHRRAQKAEGEAERAQRKLANIFSWSPDARWQGRASRRTVEDYLAHELQKVNHAEAFVYISAGDFRVFARDSDLIIDRLLEIENSVNELLKTSISLHAWSHHGSLASCVAWSAGDARYAYPLCPEAEEALAKKPVEVRSSKVRDEIAFDDPPSTPPVVGIDYAASGTERWSGAGEIPPGKWTVYWRSVALPEHGTIAADLLPAAKPLSDVGAKGPVTAMPGLDLSDLTGPLKCHEVLPGNENDPYDLPVTCSREKGHEGPHAGGTRGCTIEWGFYDPTAVAIKPVIKVGS